MKQAAYDASTTKKPDDAKQLGAYYNHNLGDVASKAGKPDDAMKAYEQAAEVESGRRGWLLLQRRRRAHLIPDALMTPLRRSTRQSPPIQRRPTPIIRRA